MKLLEWVLDFICEIVWDNHHGLNLTDQVMKFLEWVLDFICEMVNINEVQMGFVPGGGATDVIFIACQLQAKYIAAKKKLLYFAFIDLKKAFNRVPRKVLW